MTARRTCAVQMLLVALSRRMCCSRVCKREAITRPALGIVRNADEPPGHVAFVLIARRKIGGVRAAKSERNAEALRAADGDIGAEFAGRFQ